MIYIAIGQLAGTALKKVASPVLVANDNLLVGPSCRVWTRHRSARKRYWGSAPSRRLDEHLRSRQKQALCVLFPPTCNGLLSLCRISQSALETDSDLHVMELDAKGTPVVSHEVDLPRETCLDFDGALQGLPSAIRWSRLQTALAAGLWRLWCGRSPVAFSRFCGSSAALHPQLASLGRYHAGLFPRITQRGLLLSRLDELILRQLTHEWTTPARLYASAVRTSSPLAAWVTYTGDLYLANRLLAWANHAQGRLVEKQEQAGARSEMLAWSFRWRPGAEAILDTLPELESAPPQWIGGAVAYDSRHPWCSRADAKANTYVVRPVTA